MIFFVEKVNARYSKNLLLNKKLHNLGPIASHFETLKDKKELKGSFSE